MFQNHKKELSTVLSQELSFRLSILKLISIVAVIYMHSYAQILQINGKSIDLLTYHRISFAVESIVHNVTSFAVPLFFCISGYLFFTKEYKEGYLDFIWKKTKSIFFPYLLWNSICIVYMFVIQSMPFTSKYFNKAFVSSWRIRDWIHAFIGFDHNWMPFLYPLWFLLTLYFVFVLIYPMKSFLIKHPYIILLLMIFNTICPFFRFFDILLFPRLVNAFAFFCMGYLISLFLNIVDKSIVSIVSGSIFFIFQVIYSFPHAHNFFFDNKSNLYFGVIFFFSISQYFNRFPETTKNNLLSLSSFSFLLYVLHENLFTIIKKICYSVIPIRPFIPLTLFFILPLCLIVVLIAFGFILKKVSPNVYRFLFAR